MQRILCHLARAIANCAQALEQFFSPHNRGVGRCVQPSERSRICDSQRPHAQAQLGKLAPQNFWRIVLGAALEILERVEADDAAGSSASSPAGALRAKTIEGFELPLGSTANGLGKAGVVLSVRLAGATQ